MDIHYSSRLKSVTLATGGQRTLNAALILHIEQPHLFGQLGTLSWTTDAGGPLDAPEVMPAGSVDSTTWTTGNGLAVVAPTEFRREA